MLKRYGCHAHDKAIKLLEVCEHVGRIEYSTAAEGRLPRVVQNWASGKKRKLEFESFQFWDDEPVDEDAVW